MCSAWFGIPLLIQGEQPAYTLGITGDVDANTDDASTVAEMHTLAGGKASDWFQEGIGMKDLLFYQFPDLTELRKKVRAVFLGYYAKEWSFTGNTEFAIARCLRGQPGHDPNLAGKLSPYVAIDSYEMQIVNQMIKYYKFGFGFVTDEVCYRIREGRLSREEAIKLVEQYDAKCDERYIHEVCEYIGITVEEFWRVVDGFVNKKLFRRDPETGKWEPLFKVGCDFVE